MGATVRQHQLALVEMLQEVDRICRKHSIPYILFAGTALGAVRHQGFIPWDDDLDILMLRPDYDRFLQVAPGELDPQAYYLQKEYSDHWPMFFSKLRRNGTACIERFIPRDPLQHQGIYVDIFPCDNLSDSPLLAKLQFLASKVVIAKGLYRRGYLTDSPLKKVFLQLCRLIPLAPVRALTILRDRRTTARVHCFLGAASRYERAVFPRQWVSQSVPMAFEGGMYPVSAHCDPLLTVLYGDYMRIPPEEERKCKVHGELVDLEQSYEAYSGIQRTMKFETKTRSIR